MILQHTGHWCVYHQACAQWALKGQFVEILVVVVVVVDTAKPRSLRHSITIV